MNAFGIFSVLTPTFSLPLPMDTLIRMDLCEKENQFCQYLVVDVLLSSTTH